MAPWLDQLRQTKIQDLDVAALGYKDVRRLDVTVNDSLAVGGAESIRNFDPPFKDVVERQRFAGDAMLEGGAVHEFHGDKRLAVLLADLVDCADVGMIQRGCRTRLSAKAFQSLWILCEVFGEKFERDKPAEGWILRLVDNTHAAAAQLFDDSIVRDGLADHWERCGSIEADAVVAQ